MISTEQNIQIRGRDVESGTCIIRRGQQISPGIAGLAAAAGYSTVPVFKKPTVTIIGTGDEIVYQERLFARASCTPAIS